VSIFFIFTVYKNFQHSDKSQIPQIITVMQIIENLFMIVGDSVHAADAKGLIYLHFIRTAQDSFRILCATAYML